MAKELYNSRQEAHFNRDILRHGDPIITTELFGGSVSFPLAPEQFDRLCGFIVTRPDGAFLASKLGITPLAASLEEQRRAETARMRLQQPVTQTSSSPFSFLTAEQAERFSNFFLQHWNSAVSYVRSRLHDLDTSAAPADIAATVFEKMLKLWPMRYDDRPPHEQEKILFGAVRNAAMNLRRNIIVRKEASLDAMQQDEHNPFQPSDIQDEDIRESFLYSNLTPDQQQAFLFVIQNMPNLQGPIFLLKLLDISNEDVGEILEMNMDTVKQRWFHIRRKIKETLSG